MCKCTPEIRTPYCGKIGCQWQPPTPKPMKFKKKPVIIEAVKYTPFAQIPGVTEVIEHSYKDKDDTLFHVKRAFIKTLEGDMEVSDGDWVITGVQGEKYPCKPDIFEQTYEPV